MSDDSDLMIAAAATAAVFTWLGTRRRERVQRTAALHRWRVRMRAVADGAVRCWRDTPGYHFVQGIKEVFSRRR